MPKLTGLAHIGVIVSDMERSIGFYQDTLGLTLDDRYLLANGTELAFLHAGSCIVELICRTDRTVPEKPGPVDHICFDVEDIDALVDGLRLKGVPFLSEKIGSLSGGLAGVRNIFFTGPDGERIEFFDQSGKGK